MIIEKIEIYQSQKGLHYASNMRTSRYVMEKFYNPETENYKMFISTQNFQFSLIQDIQENIPSSVTAKETQLPQEMLITFLSFNAGIKVGSVASSQFSPRPSRPYSFLPRT